MTCSESGGQQMSAMGVCMLKTSSPSSRRRRAASGTVRRGSAKTIAPWSQKMRSKLASGRAPPRRSHGPAGSRAGLGHQLAGMLELPLGQVEARPAGLPAGQLDRPLRGSAAELERVLAGHVAQGADLVLGDLPDAPGGAVVRQVGAADRPGRCRRARSRRPDCARRAATASPAGVLVAGGRPEDEDSRSSLISMKRCSMPAATNATRARLDGVGGSPAISSTARPAAR